MMGTRQDLYQLCADTEYSWEDLLGTMDDRDGQWERIGELLTVSAFGWLWTLISNHCQHKQKLPETYSGSYSQSFN